MGGTLPGIGADSAVGVRPEFWGVGVTPGTPEPPGAGGIGSPPTPRKMLPWAIAVDTVSAIAPSARAQVPAQVIVVEFMAFVPFTRRSRLVTSSASAAPLRERSGPARWS